MMLSDISQRRQISCNFTQTWNFRDKTNYRKKKTNPRTVAAENKLASPERDEKGEWRK